MRTSHGAGSPVLRTSGLDNTKPATDLIDHVSVRPFQDRTGPLLLDLTSVGLETFKLSIGNYRHVDVLTDFEAAEDHQTK